MRAFFRVAVDEIAGFVGVAVVGFGLLSIHGAKTPFVTALGIATTVVGLLLIGAALLSWPDETEESNDDTIEVPQ